VDIPLEEIIPLHPLALESHSEFIPLYLTITMHTAILKSLYLLLSISSLVTAQSCNCTLTSTTTDVSTKTVTQYNLVAQSGGTRGVPLFCGYDPTSLAGTGDVSVRCFYGNSVSLNINIAALAFSCHGDAVLFV
jgi:hypothetical protein